MNHATQHHIGRYQNPTAVRTADFAQTIGRVCKLDAKTKGRQRSTEGQTEVRANSNATNGFLKCSFLPKLQEAQTVQACGKSKKTEGDFYQSLSQLAEHYGIQPMQSRQYGYPYNIALALDDAQEKLKHKVSNWEELSLIQDCRKTYLTSGERYNTHATVYYIPVIPLYLLSQNPKRKQAVQLLQSVCAYLYHIVQVPYYRQEQSYLYWMYEMVSEWVTSDDENEDLTTYVNEIKQAEQIGERMEQKIYNHHNLSRFKERLNNFKAKDSFDQDCFRLGGETLALYEQYPNEAIYRNAQPNRDTDEDENENIIAMDKYISFCADTKGLVFQSLFECVNAEFQEYTQTEEPFILKRFDGNNISGNTLDFEKRVFTIMEDLIFLLDSF